MTLSVETGKTLTECMEGTTDRQFQVWRRYLRDRWNRPGRLEHYIMRLCLEVQRAGIVASGRSPRDSGSTEPFRVKFEDKPKEERQITPEEYAAGVRARWLGMMTKKVEVRTRPKEQ